jgi:hypothetical protein
VKANILYSKDKDPKMSIISAGFLFGGIFEAINTGYSFIFNYMNPENKYLIFEFLFLSWSNLLLSSSILISLLYGARQIKESSSKFIRKTYFIYSAIAFLFILSVLSLDFIPFSLYQAYINKIFVEFSNY